MLFLHLYVITLYICIYIYVACTAIVSYTNDANIRSMLAKIPFYRIFWDYSAPHEETENHTFEVFVISLSQGVC